MLELKEYASKNTPFSNTKEANPVLVELRALRRSWGTVSQNISFAGFQNLHRTDLPQGRIAYKVRLCFDGDCFAEFGEAY
jgi:hypothetical protein